MTDVILIELFARAIIALLFVFLVLPVVFTNYEDRSYQGDLKLGLAVTGLLISFTTVLYLGVFAVVTLSS